jgi:outer membrane protein assembly factor BamB
MLRWSMRCAGTLFCALSICAVQTPADWPVFRGNALQTGVAISELPDQLAVLWTFKAKSFEGTAAIGNGVVFVGCQDEFVYAVNLADGTLKWKYKTSFPAVPQLSASTVGLMGSPLGSAPLLTAATFFPRIGAPLKIGMAISGGAVYAGDEDGKLHCLDAKTGHQRWIFDTEAEITSAPNFDGNMVLFGAGNETLYCLDKDKGGNPLWTFKVPGGPVLGSPAIIDKKTFVAGCDSSLHVIDTTKGTEIKAIDLDGQVGATPALVDDFLYVGTMTSQVQAVNLKKGTVAWTYEAKKRPQAYYASVAVTKDLVLAGSRDKCLHAIDRRTGAVKWVFPTGAKVDSSPVVVSNRVYFGSADGKLYVVDLATGKEVQALELASRGGILASPAVSGNRLVIGTPDGTLYCLGKK